MPRVVADLASLVDVPILAAGLVQTIEEVELILSAGAKAVITGKSDLWALRAPLKLNQRKGDDR